MSASDVKSSKRSAFTKNFYIANSMDIFERSAWFCFYSVSSIYMTTSIAAGGLGFSQIDRGIIRGY